MVEARTRFFAPASSRADPITRNTEISRHVPIRRAMRRPPARMTAVIDALRSHRICLDMDKAHGRSSHHALRERSARRVHCRETLPSMGTRCWWWRCPLLAACMTLTADPRALVYEPPGVRVTVAGQLSAAAPTARSAMSAGAVQTSRNALDPDSIRVPDVEHPRARGTSAQQDDLAPVPPGPTTCCCCRRQRYSIRSTTSFVVPGCARVMTITFIIGSIDIGVLTSTRAMPMANCAQRFNDPIIQLPKSNIVAWLPLAGTTRTLTISSVRTINLRP